MKSKPMIDVALLPDAVQRKAVVEHIGLVIGSCGTSPYIHLQLEQARRMFSMDSLPILVVNDGDDGGHGGSELAELCEQYGAELRSFPRSGHTMGDLRVFDEGLKWAETNNVQILVKLSRRFIPLVSWRIQLMALAAANQHVAVFGRKNEDRSDGLLRTDCVALRVRKWQISSFRETMDAALASADGIGSVENFINSWMRVLRGWEWWDLVGLDLYHAHDKAMQWRGLMPFHYGDLSRVLGLPYEDSDFEENLWPEPSEKEKISNEKVKKEKEEREKGRGIRAVVLEEDENGNPLDPIPEDKTPPQPKEKNTAEVKLTFPILTQADDGFMEAALKLKRSLDGQNNPTFSDYICLHDETLSSLGQSALEEAGWRLERVQVPDLKIGSVPQKASLFRAKIVDVVDTEFALFLDADMLVVDSLFEIADWPEKMNGCFTGAVHYPEYSIGHYNIGLLFINVRKWREMNVGANLLAYLEKTKEELLKHDLGKQEIPYDEYYLSRLFVQEGVFDIPRMFNVTPGYPVCAKPYKIVHFRGPKPWDTESEEKFPQLTEADYPKYAKLWRQS